MVRYVSSFRLKPGYDPEETVKLWKEVHVPRTVALKKQGINIRKYTISRVVSAPDAQPDFFGMSDLMFDDLDSAKKYLAHFMDKPPDAFTERITDSRRLFVLEDEDIDLQ